MGKMMVILQPKKDDLLKFPHVEIGDILMLYGVVASENKENIKINIMTDELIENSSVPRENLHDFMMWNSMREFPVMCMPIKEIPKAVRVTSSANIFGASALFYPGVMGQLSNHYQEGFYALPVTVHEWIILPEDYISPQELEKSWEKYIHDMQNEHDFLSKTIYHYDCEFKRFEPVLDYEIKLKARFLSMMYVAMMLRQ